MLIKEDLFEDFFLNNELPNDSCAICCDLVTEVDSDNVYHYYYYFDLKSMFQEYLSSSDAEDTLRMVLVPVNLVYSTSSSTTSITKVNIEQTITSTPIRSAQCADHPMDIEAVFSGFSTATLK